MKTVDLKDEATLAEVLSQNQDEEVVVVRNGRAVALVVPFDDQDLEWYARERDPAFIESIGRARQHVAEGRTVSHADLKKRLGLT
jgi:antitoxin (DNA-binding transcriptional repressor) of toxin-antitoxin stability system